MVLKNRSNEIRTNEIRIRREPSVPFLFQIFNGVNGLWLQSFINETSRLL